MDTPVKKIRKLVKRMTVGAVSLVQSGAVPGADFLVIQNSDLDGGEQVVENDTTYEDQVQLVCQEGLDLILEAEEPYEAMEAVDQLATQLRESISPTTIEQEGAVEQTGVEEQVNEIRARLGGWDIWQGFQEYLRQHVQTPEDAKTAITELSELLEAELTAPGDADGDEPAYMEQPTGDATTMTDENDIMQASAAGGGSLPKENAASAKVAPPAAEAVSPGKTGKCPTCGASMPASGGASVKETDDETSEGQEKSTSNSSGDTGDGAPGTKLPVRQEEVEQAKKKGKKLEDSSTGSKKDEGDDDDDMEEEAVGDQKLGVKKGKKVVRQNSPEETTDELVVAQAALDEAAAKVVALKAAAESTEEVEIPAAEATAPATAPVTQEEADGEEIFQETVDTAIKDAPELAEGASVLQAPATPRHYNVSPRDYLWGSLFSRTVAQEAAANGDVDDSEDSPFTEFAKKAVTQNTPTPAPAPTPGTSGPPPSAHPYSLEEVVARAVAQATAPLIEKIDEIEKKPRKTTPRSRQPEGDPAPLVNQNSSEVGSVWQGGPLAALFPRG